MKHKWAVMSVWAWNVKPEMARSAGIRRWANRQTAVVIFRTCQRSRNVVWNHCSLSFRLFSDTHATHNLRFRHLLFVCYTCGHMLYLHIHLYCILAHRFSTKRETTCSLCTRLQARKLNSFASWGPIFCFVYVLKYHYLPFSTDSLNALLFLLEYSLRK